MDPSQFEAALADVENKANEAVAAKDAQIVDLQAKLAAKDAEGQQVLDSATQRLQAVSSSLSSSPAPSPSA